MKFIIILLIIIVGFIAFGWLKNTNDITTVVIEKELTSVAKKPTTHKNSTIKASDLSKATDLINEKKKVVIYDFNEISEQTLGMDACGLGDREEISSKGFTDKQETAMSAIADYCSEWFDYLETLEQLELNTINKRRKEREETMEVWFDENLRKDVILSSVVQSYEDDPAGFGYSAIAYLLDNDHYLNLELANGINTKSPAFMRAGTVTLDIAMLYACEQRLYNCSQNGVFMLQQCTIDSGACEMNYRQYLSTQYSHNQLADMSAMSLHLGRLIDDGYPGVPIPRSD